MRLAPLAPMRLGTHEVETRLRDPPNVRDDVVLALQLVAERSEFVQRQCLWVDCVHVHPPDTGGRTASSSVAPMVSWASAGSPFTQILHVARTASNVAP